MPDEAKGKVNRTGTGKERRRRRPPDIHWWIRFFSFASVVLTAFFVLAAVMAFNHYRTYPGKVERDSICSPGRGAGYIVVGWNETHSTDVYKVWYRENTEEEDEAGQ